MAAHVWSKRNIFQLSAEIYVTFLQWKYEDHEVMQAPHILHGNQQFMRRKCRVFEKMQPRINMQTLCDYALNYAIA